MRIITLLLVLMIISILVIMTFTECTHYAINPVPPGIYIDHFETSKLSTPLGVSRRGWVQASIPVFVLNDPNNLPPPDGFALRQERSALARRGRLIWYNPYRGFVTSAIYPGMTDDQIDAGNATTPVLNLVFAPTTVEPANSLSQSWDGVMRALPPALFDQTANKFLEIWFYGTRGRLHIELGQISEDIIPNRRFDTEDTFGGIHNGVLDNGEDVGLDGVKGNDGAADFSLDGMGRDFWDLNRNGQRDWGESASNDDWFYRYTDALGDQYVSPNGAANGTENNQSDSERKPDTEDLNANGTLDLANNYFSYSFELDTVSADRRYHAGGVLSAWKLYRIPLQNAALRVGNPSFSRIEYARIWIDGFNTTRPDSVLIAELSLVGNTWKEIGIGSSEVDLNNYNLQEPRFTVSVVNTKETPSYVPPPGVVGMLDRTRYIRLPEQSLALLVNDLRADEIALAKKNLPRSENFTTHKYLRMFIHGQEGDGQPIRPDSSSLVFFLRFGANEKNFYEFRTQVFPGWDQRNAMNLDLVALSNLQFSSDDLVPGFESYFRHRLNATQELRVLGNPALSNIRVLMAGIKNLGRQPFAGEIWLDELRLIEMKR